MIKVLVGCSMFVTGVVALGACDSKVDSSDESKTVSEPAEFVAQQRDWLERYDRHCEACIVAYDLCQKGAVDDTEQVACQVAMDACIRGGLGQDDAGVGDDGGVIDVPDADAGVDRVDAGDDDDDDDDDDNDDDDDEATDEDNDVDEQVDEQADAGDVDADGGDVDDGDDLGEAVSACLEQGRTCLGADGSDVRQCLRDLKVCVKDALSGSFESTCNVQARKCRGSRDKARNVERQCHARPRL